jgi:hypothetical protein
MQTFLPYKSFIRTARTLDYSRLGKQRLEAKQILDLVENKVNNKWINHPAVRMWMGYNQCLRRYYNTIVNEWVNRGYKNNMPILPIDRIKFVKPSWLSDKRIQLSHRGNLLRKNPDYYNKFNWNVDSHCPYFWPVQMKDSRKQKIMKEYWKNG